MAAPRQRKGLSRARNERSCSVKATGMCAIAWLALLVFSAGTYCAPPHGASVRGERDVYAVRDEYRTSRNVTILHRWSDEEAVVNETGFDYSAGDESDEYGGEYTTENSRVDALPSTAIKRMGTVKRESAFVPRGPERKAPSADGRALPRKPVRSDTGTITHTVKKNDTLFSLARRHGCTIDEITGLNGLKKNDSIKVGMRLRIPVSGARRSTKREAAAGTTEPVANVDFRWPLPRVLAVRRDSAEGVKPLGVEITGSPGAVVVSAAPGTVKRIGDMRGYGRYVIISHDGRFVTVYSRMGEIRVKEGEKINAGAVIGRIDDGSRSIHFQIGRGGKPVDPLRYLPEKS